MTAGILPVLETFPCVMRGQKNVSSCAFGRSAPWERPARLADPYIHETITRIETLYAIRPRRNRSRLISRRNAESDRVFAEATKNGFPIVVGESGEVDPYRIRFVAASHAACLWSAG